MLLLKARALELSTSPWGVPWGENPRSLAVPTPARGCESLYPPWRKLVLIAHVMLFSYWLWSYEELAHWKRPWCWEGLRVGREGGNRGWDGWWHHWLDGHGFEQTPGGGEGSLQGSLACCGPRSCKASNETEGLNKSKSAPRSVRSWPCGFLTRVSRGDWLLSVDVNISDVWHTSCSRNFSVFCLLCVRALASVVSKSLRPAMLLCPWNSPGKNTGVGCCALLQEVFLTRDWTQVSCFSCIGRQALYPLCHLGSPSCHILLSFSHWVVSSSLWPDGLQHARLPCPALSPRVCSNSFHWVGDAL